MNSSASHEHSANGYECKPIYSFDELQEWKPDAEQERLFSNIPAITESVTLDGPKVLLCHDMKGGYLEDRFVRGSENCDVYTFYHWSQIDLFVYFSHYFVTIPPITWTTAAHRNGVPMLGTFITEGCEGSAICRQMLSSPETVATTVKQLVRLCEHFKFEGWLINIESQVEEQSTKSLIKFLSLLTQTMHEQIPGSKVIWYDSVVCPSGNVSWQNELNSKNVSFFNACDAIFLNYSWSKSSLLNSAALAEPSGRRYDVYVGIDVFGRGCFGGGGMNTNLAVNEALNTDLSLAIFAPGWVHEILGSEKFHENQQKFWFKLNLPIRRLLSCLPLESSFCRGFGKYTFKNGLICNGKPWSNLILQDIQISPHLPFHVDDGFEGGGCLLVPNNYSLLRCHIVVPDSGCLVILVHKPLAASVDVSLLVNSASNDQHFVSFSPLRSEAKTYLLKLADLFRFLHEQNDESPNEVNGWLIDSFLVNKDEVNVINELRIRIEGDEINENSLLLGNIRILKNPASQFNVTIG